MFFHPDLCAQLAADILDHARAAWTTPTALRKARSGGASVTFGLIDTREGFPTKRQWSWRPGIRASVHDRHLRWHITLRNHFTGSTREISECPLTALR
jgi:hypothetical protein